MKLPSIQQVLQEAGRSFLRFPLVLIDAAIGTLAALMLIDHEGPAQPSILFSILFAAILGIPLLLGLALAAEKRRWSRPLSFVLQGIGVLLLVAYAASVPVWLADAPAIHVLRLLILAAALVLFVAVAPYLAANELNGFWHYNKSHLYRLLTAALYSVVLFAGFSVALAALDNLFGVDVPAKRYAELWFLIVGLFSTWFFLAGVPEDLDSLEKSADYPKSLKVFAQYILSPLVLVYLVILYAYVAKILIAWDWPQGWVSKLILGFSATGLLSLILLYPIRDLAENRWIKMAWRWFFVILIPVVIMLPLAVWRRVSQYGITEGRYLGLALAAWLAFIVIYFLFSRDKNIKMIPGSLGLFALLVSFGPWGIFAVSENSQIGRLEVMLAKNVMLADGKAQKASTELSNEDSRQISSIITYLHDIHGYDRIQPWFQKSLRQDSTRNSHKYKEPAEVTDMLGIEYMRGWMSKADRIIQLDAKAEGVTNIGGFEHSFRALNIDENKRSLDFPEQGLRLSANDRLDIVTLIFTQDGEAPDSLQVDLRPLMERMVQDYSETNPNNIPPEQVSVGAASASVKVKVYLRRLVLERKESVITPKGFSAEIFYATGKK